jgi:hypothetical protein
MTKIFEGRGDAVNLLTSSIENNIKPLPIKAFRQLDIFSQSPFWFGVVWLA